MPGGRSRLDPPGACRGCIRLQVTHAASVGTCCRQGNRPAGYPLRTAGQWLAAGPCIGRATPEPRRRELLPEYQRRLPGEGRASADTWRQAEATRLGRRDGDGGPGRLRARSLRGRRDATCARANRPVPAAVRPPARAAVRLTRSCLKGVTRQRRVPSMSCGAMQDDHGHRVRPGSGLTGARSVATQRRLGGYRRPAWTMDALCVPLCQAVQRDLRATHQAASPVTRPNTVRPWRQ